MGSFFPARLAVDFDEIRRLTITALFSDDELYEQIVLKGGNAISLVYGYSSRGSLDLDFSISRTSPTWGTFEGPFSKH